MNRSGSQKPKERQKPFFDRFLDEHPKVPLLISCISLVVAVIVLALNILTH